MTTAEQLAVAVAAVTDPAEMALIEAAMGPVDERNRPLVSALLTLLDAAGSLADAIADNAIDTDKRVPHQAFSLAEGAVTRIKQHLAVAAIPANSEALPALPQGHRLRTNLDAYA